MEYIGYKLNTYCWRIQDLWRRCSLLTFFGLYESSPTLLMKCFFTSKVATVLIHIACSKWSLFRRLQDGSAQGNILLPNMCSLNGIESARARTWKKIAKYTSKTTQKYENSPNSLFNQILISYYHEICICIKL